MTYLYIISLFVITKYLHDFFNFQNRPFMILIFASLNAFVASFINWIFLLNIYSSELIYLLISIVFLLSIILVFKIQIVKFNIKVFFNNKFFIIVISSLIITFFILALQYPSDADSLDYHIGAPKFWLKDGAILNYQYWSHYRLFGIGEIINFLGFLLGSDNIGSLFQFLFFPLFTYMIFCRSIKLEKKSKFTLLIFIFSCPLLISLISTQKFMAYPYLILIACFFYIESLRRIKKINVFESIIIFSSLFFVLAAKISFFFIVCTLLIYYVFILYKKKYFKEVINISIILIIIFLFINFPFYLRNWIFYSDPLSPFLEFLKFDKDEGLERFAIYLQDYRSKFFSVWDFFYRLQEIFITFKPGYFTGILGLNCLIIFLLFFFKTKNNFREKLIFIISILCIAIMGQLSARYYFLSFILLIYFYIKQSDKITLKFLKIFSFVQIFCILISVNFLNFQYLFLEKNVFLSKYSYQYDQFLWLKENKIKGNIITDLRSIYYVNFNNYNTSTLKWSDKKVAKKNLKKIIANNRIEYVSFTSEMFNEYLFFLKGCELINKKKFIIKSRNPFNTKNKYIERYIFKLNKRCL